MLSFELDKHEASIANVNQRIQRHGEERRLAADIKFSLSAGNSVLDAFDPHLRQDLFRAPGQGEQQELPGTGNGLTEVKHPALEPIRVSHEWTGYELQIGGMLEAVEPIVLVTLIAPKRAAVVDLTDDSTDGADADDAAIAQEEADRLTTLGKAA